MGWVGVGWGGAGCFGMGWDGTGRDEMGWRGAGSDGIGWAGMRKTMDWWDTYYQLYNRMDWDRNGNEIE